MCEMLSSLSNEPVSERDFVISAPVAVDGVITTVMVEPRNKTRLYGFQQVQYKRVDLSAQESLTLDWRGEVNTHQVVRRAALVSQFPYRLFAALGSSLTVPRRLRLATEDIAIEPVFANTNLTAVVLKALETSDFFIGSWTVYLRRGSA